jgi:hypothetical protein
MIDLGGCVVEQLEENTVEVTGMLEEVRAGATKLWKELAFYRQIIHPPTHSFVCLFVHCSQAANAKAEKKLQEEHVTLTCSKTSSKSWSP